MEQRDQRKKHISCRCSDPDREKLWTSEIRTKRLLLREIASGDAQTIVKLRNDPRVYRFFCSPHPITIEEHLQWYTERYLSDENRCDWLAFSENRPIGIFAMIRLEDTSKIEVNYWLYPDSWGKGYAQEAVNALIEKAKNTLSISAVCAVIHCQNTASIKFAERMGFRKMGAKDCFSFYEKRLET